jgi:macrolide-specific efflux system membrane fusion protein
MKRKLFLILVLSVAGGGAIFVSMGGLAATAAATTYLTSEATVGDVSDDVAATGAIETVASYGLTFGSAAHLVDDGSSADAGAGATWPVESVDVAVGDAVTKGDPLATASATDLQSELNGAIAGRRSAALQLEIAQEQLDDASGTDETRQAKLSLYQAQAQLVQAEATQHDLEAQIAAAKLVAPIDGIVTAVNIVAGLDAPAGDAIVIDAATYDVTADVVESDISSISVGQPATVTVDAIDGEIDGTVTAIAPAATAAESGGVVSYAVTVALENPPADLLPGMTADLTITTASASDVLTIPAAALNGTNGAYAVQVLGADGAAEVRQVTVGLVTSALVEVKSGLSAGEAIITGTAADRAATTTNPGGGLDGPAGGGGAFPGGGGRFVAP